MKQNKITWLERITMEHALCAAQFEGTIDYYLKDKRAAT